MPLPSGFRCNKSLVHGLEVVYDGLYDVDLSPLPEVVLDIGANAGAFARWSLVKWPNAKLICYEPSASTLRNLYENLSPDKYHPQVEIRGKAVTALPGPYVPLYDGRQNTGERSIYLGQDNVLQCESVEVEHPKDLPPADVLKLDCEGAECEILEHYPHLNKVRACMMEWHKPQEIPHMIDALARAGLRISRQNREERLFILKHHSEL